ncbi:MAG TPA: T9SS type A sorting domain-containing protein, partial [Bacteroidales bacterium]|nr:T9SS type A sorting domain-containing protein [Bacteroidales bacterium]
NRVNAIYVRENNLVWFGTSDGLAKYDNGSWTTYNSSNSGLTNSAISVITPANQYSLWIGTGGTFANGGGVYTFYGSNWTNYNTSNSPITDNRISAIYIDSNNNKWIACAYNGLMVYNENGVNLSAESIQVQNNRVMVFPNPAGDYLEIYGNNTNVILQTIEIFNTSGQCIMVIEPQFDTHRIDISSLPQGLYLVKIKTNTGSLVKKLIKN